MNWFECKVSYDKMTEGGMPKHVTEPYLVDAITFSDAEARIVKEIRPYISGEFVVTDIKRARIAEIFFNESGDRYYRVKVQFITLDEKSGAEKRTSANMLAQACDIAEALDVFNAGMKGTMSDYVIASITETAIMDIFRFSAEDVEYEHKDESEED